ncbi:MAG: cell division protein FtsX [bacterium]
MISQRVNYIANYFGIALSNIKSNRAGNIFAFSIMSFSFFIMLFFLLCYVNIYNYMSVFQKNNAMFVFLKNNADKNKVVNFIGGINGIKNAVYYNGESSMKFLKRRSEHLKFILKNINSAQMPAFIKINFKRNAAGGAFLTNVYLRLKLLKGVKSVHYNKMLRSKIVQFMFFTKVIGLILFLFLFILSIFISYSAIKLVILRKQNEIEILRLIGATNSYIRIPMFIEGGLGAILSFAVSFLLLFAIYRVFIFYRFDGFLEFFHIKIIFLNLRQIVLVFIIAIISGFAGTYLSSKKFF